MQRRTDAEDGVVQYVKWDANGNTTDGSSGYEATQLGNPLGTGVTSDTQTINSTGFLQGATIAVRARDLRQRLARRL